jgi:hypothetical protein
LSSFRLGWARPIDAEITYDDRATHAGKPHHLRGKLLRACCVRQMIVVAGWQAYNCADYFRASLAQDGWWEPHGQWWYMEPAQRIHEDGAREFLVIGRPTVDGFSKLPLRDDRAFSEGRAIRNPSAYAFRQVVYVRKNPHRLSVPGAFAVVPNDLYTAPGGRHSQSWNYTGRIVCCLAGSFRVISSSLKCLPICRVA